MKLARLEIVGFKSFADKVTLNFSDGITAVVGPNGCGKSNIVDSIRWVMGEQSAKHLRGGKMEDVIFAGSDSRGPMGMSEVTLTLKNDGRVPSEYANYDEIAVRRRLFRDGASEYYINKTPCRLKDIHDLFLGTGVGTRAYSMIEQGRIGFIVNSKPEERRFLIEEVAGITKYKARKKTAQRRMEATEANLLRVNDIVTELGRQLGSLERQAKKAERYKELKEELRLLELWWASMRFLELRAGLVYAINEMERLQQGEDDRGNALAAVEAELETARLRLATTEEENARYSEQVHGLDAKLRVLERDLEFFTKERESLGERGAQAAEEAETLTTQLETVRGEISVLEEHAATLGGETETVMYELEQKEQALKALTQQRRSLESRAEALQKEMIDALTLLANERATVQNNDRRRIELSARIERHEGEQKEAAAQLAQASNRASTASGDAERLEALVDDLRLRLEALTEQVARGKQVTHAAAAKVLSLKEQTGEKKSRLTSLQEIATKYEGYGDGVRALMTERAKNDQGILGLVADVIAAKSDHEGALEAVLGARLQDVIVASGQSGVDALAWLKAEATGRATFVPAELRERAAFQAPAGEGVLGRFVDLVTVKPGNERIAKYLLGNVVLTDTTESALRAAATAAEGTVFVSLSGDVVDAFGALTGGKTKGVSQGLLAQKREIKELEEEVRRLENAVLLAEAERTAAQLALTSSEEQEKATAEELKRSEIQKAGAEKDAATLSNEVARLTQRTTQLDKEIASLVSQRTELDVASKACAERMAAAETQHQEKERELATLTDRDSTLRDDEAYAQEALTQLKVSFAQRDEKQKNVVRTLERLTQNVKETEERIARAKSTVQNGSQQAIVLGEKIARGKEERVTLLDLLETGKATLQEGRIRHEQLQTEVRAAEEKVRALSKDANGLRDEKTSWDVKAREAVMQIEHLKKSIFETYQLDVEHELTDFHMRTGLPADAAEEISRMRQQISRMGDINLTAIEEFQEVSQRHTFLVTQKEDLETALTQLRSAIIKINRTSRDRFQEAFTATNTMFQKVFPRLFRGGEARLELMLEGSDDLLESGIDIIAMPPGKKLQNVGLLSGGEKALTAVSLVFSIFLIKPSPFCVLDEVDAPLDESNVARFNELLREISQVSQFICITHSKKTMECADRLYGITMEEPGISKLVSVDLRRAEKVPEGSIISP